MATITSDTTDRVAAIIGDTLNGWYQDKLRFGPITVRQLLDHWNEEYLHAYIVWEGDYRYMDHRRRSDLVLELQPRLAALGVDLDLHPAYVEKWDWDLNHARLLE